MKTVLLFLVSLFAGFTIISVYTYWHGQQLGNIIKPSNVVKTDFSLKNAPQKTLKGNVASTSGTVKWLSRVAAKSVQIHAPHKVQQGESLSTGKNSEAVVTINNAAAISILSNTDVNFIQLLPINVVLEQNDGSVTYQNTIQVPISVRSFNLVTVLTQGVATIAADKRSKTVIVTILKGVAREGYQDTQSESNIVTLTAGEQFVFDDTTREGTTSEIPGFVSNDSLPFGH